ncbi:hypothetical protein N7508_002566 [Penicillium antarcticum]|nr:uncharacterized protein N7508_002566 [Penicillium antarcticum]KAJ5318058.1 hypothetical protein N7508_002566 [Penicillium antarcticum]
MEKEVFSFTADPTAIQRISETKRNVNDPEGLDQLREIARLFEQHLDNDVHIHFHHYTDYTGEAKHLGQAEQESTEIVTKIKYLSLPSQITKRLLIWAVSSLRGGCGVAAVVWKGNRKESRRNERKPSVNFPFRTNKPNLVELFAIKSARQVVVDDIHKDLAEAVNRGSPYS